MDQVPALWFRSLCLVDQVSALWLRSLPGGSGLCLVVQVPALWLRSLPGGSGLCLVVLLSTQTPLQRDQRGGTFPLWFFFLPFFIAVVIEELRG